MTRWCINISRSIHIDTPPIDFLLVPRHACCYEEQYKPNEDKRCGSPYHFWHLPSLGWCCHPLGQEHILQHSLVSLVPVNIPTVGFLEFLKVSTAFDFDTTVSLISPSLYLSDRERFRLSKCQYNLVQLLSCNHPSYYKVVVFIVHLQGLYAILFGDTVDCCSPLTTRWFQKGYNHSLFVYLLIS